MPSFQSRLFRMMLRREKNRTDRTQPVELQRADMVRLTQATKPAKNTTVETVPVGGMEADWVTPATETTGGVILYLHGGGYALGSRETHRALTTHIAAAAATRVLLPAYRLAPEHPYPAALEDAVTAYRWLLDAGYDPAQIVIMGDSAGGGLALATTLYLRDSGDPLPAAVVAMSPLTDVSASGESVVTRRDVDPLVKPEDIVVLNHYVGANNPCDPYISPLFARHDGLPLVYLQVGDHEVMLSDATRFGVRAKAAGVDVRVDVFPHMWHVWQILAPLLPEANAAIRELGAYVQNALAGEPERVQSAG